MRRQLSLVLAVLIALSADAIGEDPKPADAGPAPQSAAGELPPGFESLAPLLGDEKALVEELRKTDRAMQAQADAQLKQAAATKDANEAAALKAQAKERFAKLRTAYEAALRRYPDNARLRNFNGELLYDRFGEVAGAMKEWNLAVSLDPKLADVHNNLALHYFHTGGYEQGLREIDEAIALDPENPDYLFNIVQIYMVNGPQIQKLRKWDSQEAVYKEAMKLSKKAIKFSPDDYTLWKDYGINFWKAKEMGAKPQWREAAKTYAEARKRAPNDTEKFNCYMQEARAHKEDKNYKRAQEALEEALKIVPGSPVAQQLLAEMKSKR